MKQSQLLTFTLRESPADVEVVSHRLLLRAGYIRQLAAGIYTYLPLGRKVLHRIESIIREEMEVCGVQEILMPALQPAELWKESGRYDAYGEELIRLTDRHEREFVLGPTHEEVITSLLSNEISSYRQLPVSLYQIQTKFRDERRPRFGLMRGREFLMKDAYSFNTSKAELRNSYEQMREAYHRIFTRCGFDFRMVEADAGTIGGDGWTHEFMALTEIGEDTLAVCTHCTYAANLEKAESGEEMNLSEKQQIFRIHTLLADQQPVMVITKGNHEVNELKVQKHLQAHQIEIIHRDRISQFNIAAEYMEQADLYELLEQMSNKLRTLVDHTAAVMMQSAIDPLHTTAGDFRNAVEGERCPRCQQGQLQFLRGIELGHVFELGNKYSLPMEAGFTDESGKQQAFWMGCYGIGISRMLSAVVEQHHDDQGICWPIAIAPYQVHLIPVSIKDTTQMELAFEIYRLLQSKGIEVLLDDRDERAGVKFKDADLIGIPNRIVVGKHSLERHVEWINRAEGEKKLLHLDDLFDEIFSFE